MATGREIVIKKVLNGFIVNVGCQTVVFKDENELILELKDYFANPEKVEKKYYSEVERTLPNNGGLRRIEPVDECAQTSRY